MRFCSGVTISRKRSASSLALDHRYGEGQPLQAAADLQIHWCPDAPLVEGDIELAPVLHRLAVDREITSPTRRPALAAGLLG